MGLGMKTRNGVIEMVAYRGNQKMRVSLGFENMA